MGRALPADEVIVEFEDSASKGNGCWALVHAESILIRSEGEVPEASVGAIGRTSQHAIFGEVIAIILPTG